MVKTDEVVRTNGGPAGAPPTAPTAPTGNGNGNGGVHGAGMIGGDAGGSGTRRAGVGVVSGSAPSACTKPGRTRCAVMMLNRAAVARTVALKLADVSVRRL